MCNDLFFVQVADRTNYATKCNDATIFLACHTRYFSPFRARTRA